MMRSQEKEGFAKYSFYGHNEGGPTMSEQMVGLCWTAVSSRLGLISSTFALYQFLELDLYQVLQEYPHARLNPSQVCMFRRTVFNDQKSKFLIEGM